MTVERHNAHEVLVQNLVITPPSENAKYARLQTICTEQGVDFDEAVVQNVRSYYSFAISDFVIKTCEKYFWDAFI